MVIEVYWIEVAAVAPPSMVCAPDAVRVIVPATVNLNVNRAVLLTAVGSETLTAEPVTKTTRSPEVAVSLYDVACVVTV